MQLGKYPRVRFAHAPTPLEPMPRLSAALGGPTLWVKRDDCTGLATGGNKTRKLEFLVADALKDGADTLITVGATQSNHVRQTAAAAAKMGLRCVVLLENRGSQATDLYKRNGNVMLDHLLGAEVRHLSGGTDMAAAMEEVAGEIRRNGGKPYAIPGGGSNPIGALGYVASAQEMLAQSAELGFAIDVVVHATGSCGTQAGLVVGFEAAQSGVDVVGMTVRRPRAEQEPLLQEMVDRVVEYVGLRHRIGGDRIRADSDYVGEGYGIPTAGMIEAVRMAARLEGLILDPVYAGKAMAGLIEYCRTGRFKAGQNVVFVHTGGQAALFAYEPVFAV